LNHARSGLPYQTYRDFGKSAFDRISAHRAAGDGTRRSR